jgi:nucleoid-associated protein YgaU
VTRDSIDRDAAPPRPDPTVLAPAPAAPPTAPPTAPAAATGEHYVVVAGDCLWAIARRRLGARAANADIDAGWRAIYAANRAAIGDDPGLIHPGLALVLPPLAATP